MINHPVISTHGSMDATDSGSVTSHLSGFGTESNVGSETSGMYASVSSRDLGRSATFPVNESNSGEVENDQYGNFMTAASFETGTRRLALSGLPSPALSNLMEDRPFHSDIRTSFSGEGKRFDFGGLPASPAVHNKSFSEDSFGDVLHKKGPITPLTAQSLAFSDSLTTNEEISVPLPDLPPRILERNVSKGGELPNSMAESVLVTEEENNSPWREQHKQGLNPWKETNDSSFSKLETDLNNLLLSGNNNNSVDDFPFATFQSKSAAKSQSDWTPLTGTALTPSSSSNATAVHERFDDDGVGFQSSSPVRADGESPVAPEKNVNKWRSTSRWKFM